MTIFSWTQEPVFYKLWVTKVDPCSISNFKYLEMNNKQAKSKQAKRDLQMNKEIKRGGA
jgi:hypothetical protein